MDWMSAMSGGTSTDSIGKAFDQLVNDADISAIILEIDSPGGSVYGLEELSNKIRSARGKKPIVAVANSLMASAAYYVGSAADEIAVTPGGEVGSIGTIAVHLDTSKADEIEGFKYTIIKAGDFKGIANGYEPLNKDGVDYLQGIVNQYYDMFLSAVAKNRGITKDDVRKNYGQGKVFIASDAVKQGLADRIETLDQTIGRISRKVRYGR
jgi:signal peptide peptidase SppA